MLATRIQLVSESLLDEQNEYLTGLAASHGGEYRRAGKRPRATEPRLWDIGRRARPRRANRRRRDSFARLPRSALRDQIRREAAEPVAALVVLAGHGSEAAVGVRPSPSRERRPARVGRPAVLTRCLRASTRG